MPTEILVIGAGGHAKVVIEACILAYPNTKLVIADQDLDKVGISLLGKHRVELLNTVERLSSSFHVAIGHNAAREKLCSLSDGVKDILVSVIHPDAVVSPSAKVCSGSFIAARSVVSSDTVINEGCIINHGAVVDHDCHIGAFTHIAPNATLCGGVTVGKGCLIGAGATILPMVNIGCNAVIGAGAVIKSDVPACKTVVGIPGKQR